MPSALRVSNAKIVNGRQILASARFFGLFYEWNTISRSSKCPHRSFHGASRYRQQSQAEINDSSGNAETTEASTKADSSAFLRKVESQPRGFDNGKKNEVEQEQKSTSWEQVLAILDREESRSSRGVRKQDKSGADKPAEASVVDAGNVSTAEEETRTVLSANENTSTSREDRKSSDSTTDANTGLREAVNFIREDFVDPQMLEEKTAQAYARYIVEQKNTGSLPTALSYRDFRERELGELNAARLDRLRRQALNSSIKKQKIPGSPGSINSGNGLAENTGDAQIPGPSSSVLKAHMHRNETLESTPDDDSGLRIGLKDATKLQEANGLTWTNINEQSHVPNMDSTVPNESTTEEVPDSTFSQIRADLELTRQKRREPVRDLLLKLSEQPGLWGAVAVNYKVLRNMGYLVPFPTKEEIESKNLQKSVRLSDVAQSNWTMKSTGEPISVPDLLLKLRAEAGSWGGVTVTKEALAILDMELPRDFVTKNGVKSQIWANGTFVTFVTLGDLVHREDSPRADAVSITQPAHINAKRLVIALDLLLQLSKTPELWNAVVVSRKLLWLFGASNSSVTKRDIENGKVSRKVRLSEVAQSESWMMDSNGKQVSVPSLLLWLRVHRKGWHGVTLTMRAVNLLCSEMGHPQQCSRDGTSKDDTPVSLHDLLNREIFSPSDTAPSRAMSHADTTSNTITTTNSKTSDLASNPIDVNSVAPRMSSTFIPRADDPPPSPLSRDEISSSMRALMRKVPHAVTVITAATLDSQVAAGAAVWRGMTVSSFNTVSLGSTLAPSLPVVSFNVKVPSATYSAIQETRYFLAHLMPSSVTAARIANILAGAATPKPATTTVTPSPASTTQNTDSAPTGNSRVLPDTMKALQEAGLPGISVQVDPKFKIPCIMGVEGTSILMCKLIERGELAIGDHVVVVAEVLDIADMVNTGARITLEAMRAWVAASDKSRLLYVDGAYREVGEAFDLSNPNEPSSVHPQQVKTDPSFNVNKPVIHNSMSINHSAPIENPIIKPKKQLLEQTFKIRKSNDKKSRIHYDSLPGVIDANANLFPPRPWSWDTKEQTTRPNGEPAFTIRRTRDNEARPSSREGDFTTGNTRESSRLDDELGRAPIPEGTATDASESPYVGMPQAYQADDSEHQAIEDEQRPRSNNSDKENVSTTPDTKPDNGKDADSTPREADTAMPLSKA